MPSSATPEIGPVIQRHRKARGWTLEQIADLSGVSKSMLSQIERGQANPTFAVLWSLTRALGIDFADLVDDAGPSEPGDIIEITGHQATPSMQSADGLCRLRIFSPPHLAGVSEWYEIEIDPGGALDSTPHAPGAFEHLTVYDGKLEVTSAAASRVVGSGETARYPADTEHRIANTSNEMARALLVVLFR